MAASSKRMVPGPALPGIPWEDRPAGCSDVLWRYSGNPIIPRDAIPRANSIFNSAAVPFGDAFAGVFRIDDKRRWTCLHAGFSNDGIRWRLNPDPIIMTQEDPETPAYHHGYDPRVCWLEDRYIVTWCNHYCGMPVIGMAWTRDFETFHQMENSFLPFNRNGVMFPRKINGRHMMLSRPSDNGHTPFGDIFLSQSPDLTYWGRHRFVMSSRREPWESVKIGAGPIPIETSEGWLLIYHGVLNSCNGFVYSFSAALLDLEQPWKVIARARPYLLSPQTTYECVGDVPNVAFPCAALVDPATLRMAVYYGCADTVTGLAFGRVDEVVSFVRANDAP